MIELAKNVVLVKGAKRGAIYNLNTGEVYSINDEAVKIIEAYQLEGRKHEYLDVLLNENLFDYAYQNKKYEKKQYSNTLDLVWLEITQACNMRCVHCYEGQTHVSQKDVLTLEEWKRNIDEIAELNVAQVVVIGGEPCVHKNIIDILEYLSEKRISTTLFTNGYFIKRELLKKIIELKIKVKVSLYGHNETVHDKITGISGSFKQLIYAIEELTSNGIDVNIAVTLMKENEAYVKEIEEFLKKMPIKGYKFDVIREVIDGTQREHIPANKEVVQMAFRKKPRFYVSQEKFNCNSQCNSCWRGKLVITEDGTVIPCVFARNQDCGNVRETSLAEIINTKLSGLWGLSLENVNDCNVCEYRYACKDCRPIAEAVGDIKSKNPRCMYNPYKGEWNNE